MKNQAKMITAFSLLSGHKYTDKVSNYILPLPTIPPLMREYPLLSVFKMPISVLYCKATWICER